MFCKTILRAVPLRLKNLAIFYNRHFLYSKMGILVFRTGTVPVF